jgi:transposase
MLRQLEQRFPALPPLGQEGRLEAYFQCVSGQSRLRIPDHRLHHRASPPTCGGRKRGSEDEAIGRSRGGLSTKISVGVDALGNPVRFILTAGQVHDILQAEDLISGIAFEHLLADKGYDANWLRARVAAVGAEAVIPSTRSRSQAFPYDKHIYQERNLVERFFNKIKHFRRIATRYEKTALSFGAMLFLVGAMIWLR